MTGADRVDLKKPPRGCHNQPAYRDPKTYRLAVLLLESLESFRGDGCEEVDEIAVRVPEHQ